MATLADDDNLIDDNYVIVFDAERFIYSIELVIAGAMTLSFVYLERVKNFEKFNVDSV
jgi:hypothetical protein